MTEADLQRIESTLGLQLPAFYRGYMLEYPRWLPESQPEGYDVAAWEFTNDPARVIHFNRYVREFESGEFFDDIPWPDHYFVIGSEQEQNWYFLDFREGSQTVYDFHHEMGNVGRVAGSLSEFPVVLLEWWEDVARAG